MQDVSDKLLGQFVGVPGAAWWPAGWRRLRSDVAGGYAGATRTTGRVVPDVSGVETPSEPPKRREYPRWRPRSPRRTTRSNLGSAVLPVLAKTYWKPAVGVVVVAGLVIWWVAAADSLQRAGAGLRRGLGYGVGVGDQLGLAYAVDARRQLGLEAADREHAEQHAADDQRADVDAVEVVADQEARDRRRDDLRELEGRRAAAL